MSLFNLSYVKVIGLTAVGLAATDHTIVDAQSGIVVNGGHHIIIRDCRVKDCSGAGIGGYDKYWDKDGMKSGLLVSSRSKATKSAAAPSGASTSPAASACVMPRTPGWARIPSGYNFVIRNNICYGNENKIGEFTKDIKNVATATDGNGIIIDTFTTNNHYPYNVLVEGNLCYDNGGRGIHVFQIGQHHGALQHLLA